MSDINKLISGVKADLNIFQATTEDNVLALITTIESQQEKLKECNETIARREKIMFEKCELVTELKKERNQYRQEVKNERELSESIVAEREQLYATIESQKEEMINQAIIRDQFAVATLQEFTKKNAEIESLKAITELAVKGLKVQRLLMLKGQIVGFESDTVFWERCIYEIDTTCSEIERLSQ